MRARPRRSATVTPSSSRYCSTFAHSANDTSHGVPRLAPASPCRVVRWGKRCSASLSSSIVWATNASDSSVGSGTITSIFVGRRVRSCRSPPPTTPGPPTGGRWWTSRGQTKARSGCAPLRSRTKPVGPGPTGGRVHILTAWDPGPARPGPEVNRVRQASLEADLRSLGLPLFAAAGVDPVTGRREEGVAVGDARETDVLALGVPLRPGRRLRLDAAGVGHRGLPRRPPPDLGLVVGASPNGDFASAGRLTCRFDAGRAAQRYACCAVWGEPWRTSTRAGTTQRSTPSWSSIPTPRSFGAA